MKEGRANEAHQVDVEENLVMHSWGGWPALTVLVSGPGATFALRVKNSEAVHKRSA